MTNDQNARRRFLVNAGYGIGAYAFSGLLPGGGFISSVQAAEFLDPLAPKQPHHAPQAKAVIWLHMAGAPSTLDLFDYKPDLVKLHGQPLPDSF